MALQYLRAFGYTEADLRRQYPHLYVQSTKQLAPDIPKEARKPTYVSSYVYNDQLSVYENFARECVDEKGLSTNKLRKKIIEFIEELMEEDNPF